MTNIKRCVMTKNLRIVISNDSNLQAGLRPLASLFEACSVENMPASQAVQAVADGRADLAIVENVGVNTKRLPDNVRKELTLSSLNSWLGLVFSSENGSHTDEKSAFLQQAATIDRKNMANIQRRCALFMIRR